MIKTITTKQAEMIRQGYRWAVYQHRNVSENQSPAGTVHSLYLTADEAQKVAYGYVFLGVDELSLQTDRFGHRDVIVTDAT
jgi:hypothetical protein